MILHSGIPALVCVPQIDQGGGRRALPTEFHAHLVKDGLFAAVQTKDGVGEYQRPPESCPSLDGSSVAALQTPIGESPCCM